MLSFVNNFSLLLSVAITLPLPFADAQPLLAFPSAKGFAKATPGGRGGQVLIVDDLSDNPKKPKKNTLRWAVSQKGPRIVIFARSGYITLKDTLSIEEPFLTLAGQTAPHGGVTIRGAEVEVKTHDVVIRYLRFRLGSTEGFMKKCDPKKEDCTKDTLTLNRADHVILDHVSLSWSVDEVFSGVDSSRITIQNSIIADPLARPESKKGKWLHNEKQTHAYCSLFRGSSDVSFIHNLLANCERRMPQASPKGKRSSGMFVGGNYIYNFDPKNGATTWNASKPGSKEAKIAQIAIINNFYDLPSGKPEKPIGFEPPNEMKVFEVFLSGNLGPTRRDLGQGNDWDLVFYEESASKRTNREEIESKTPFAEFPGVYLASEIAEKILPSVGASIPNRDAIDLDLLERISARKDQLIDNENKVGGYPKIPEVSMKKDSDQDGIPDEWEEIYGSNPKLSDSQQVIDEAGYTLLDHYLETLTTADAQYSYFGM